jgi:hypothetical protein
VVSLIRPLLVMSARMLYVYVNVKSISRVFRPGPPVFPVPLGAR